MNLDRLVYGLSVTGCKAAYAQLVSYLSGPEIAQGLGTKGLDAKLSSQKTKVDKTYEKSTKGERAQAIMVCATTRDLSYCRARRGRMRALGARNEMRGIWAQAHKGLDGGIS